MVKPEDWAWLDSIVSQVDGDFVQAANEQPAQQERPAVDEFFGKDISRPTRRAD